MTVFQEIYKHKEGDKIIGIQNDIKLLFSMQL